VQRKDVRVLQIGGRADFRQESFGAQRRGEVGMQHFHSDAALVPQVPREIDGGHAAAPDFPIDLVTTAEGGGERGTFVHGDARLQGVGGGQTYAPNGDVATRVYAAPPTTYVGSAG